MTVKWQAVCAVCGKGGTINTRYDDKRPHQSPTMSGTCTSSPDKKHHPRWEMV